MTHTRDIQKFQRQKMFLNVVLVAGMVLLIAANILAWIYLQRIKDYFISDLRFRLENTARMSTSLIDPSDLNRILPDDPGDPELIYYQQILAEIRENNELEDIYILTRTGEMLIDPDFDLRPGRSHRGIDSSMLNRIRAGRVVSTGLQSLGDHKFMQAGAPLIDSNNILTGIIIVEAPAAFFSVLDQFDRGFISFSAINIVVIIIVVLLFLRAFHRVFSLQNKMKNQEHLVLLGEMAASVAHEIRNPLSIIKGTHSLIEKKYGTEDDEFFTYIPGELDRLNRLISDFLTFARTREPEIRSISLHDLFDRIRIGIIDHPDIRLNLVFEDDVSHIRTDPDMLEQVLLNVITNAVQAMDQSGEIDIRVRRERKRVVIAVSDTGPGIEPDIAGRLFEPFFSTREKGSGLGLAISARLIEQLNGEIRYEPAEKSGARFIIKIPVN